MMIGSLCSLLPYGAGICHYAFISCFQSFIAHPFLFYIFILSGLGKLDRMVNNTSMS